MGNKRVLTLVTLILIIHFWAWSMLGPLASRYGEILSLSPFQISTLVAMPVIVGSLGRIVLGALSDRYGGKKIFTSVSFLSAIPVFLLAIANSYAQLLILGFFLGLSGAIFSVGIPFINSWFPKEKRGLALGIYGVGNIGVAVSGFLTIRLASWHDLKTPFIVVGISLLLSGCIAHFLLQDSPKWTASKEPFGTAFFNALKLKTTLNLSLVYGLTFGAFVAFGMYLPVLLKTIYALSATDASARAAGFVIVAIIARPIGGWLSDRRGGEEIIKTSLFLSAIVAMMLSFQQPLGAFVTLQYLGLAFLLGLGNGAVFELVSRLSPPKLLGSVSGIVGAIGGLGGLFPPLIMGLSYQYTQSYSIAISLFSITTIVVFVIFNRNFR